MLHNHRAAEELTFFIPQSEAVILRRAINRIGLNHLRNACAGAH